MKITECIELFLSYLSDKSVYTVKNYKIDLYQFADILKDKDVENIKKADIAKFRMVLQSKKYKSSTIARKLASVNSFFNYLIDMEVISTSPITKSHRPKISNTIPTSLTYEEVQNLLKVADNFMDKAILTVMLATGLRASELIGIKRQDILVQIDNNLHSIDTVIEKITEEHIAFIKVKGKGDKERIVPLQGKPLITLVKYIKQVNFEYIFPISYITLWRKIIKLGKKAGIRLHPHKLRHTTATFALQSGAELRVIQELLGHASPLTTARYAKVNQKQLIQATKTLTDFLVEK